MTASRRLLIYGAYGYIGQQVLQEALRQGLHPVIAGRDRPRLEALAREHGVIMRVFPLDDPAALDAGLADQPLVLNCAGPFAHTAGPMLAACLRQRCDYLDVSDEARVLARLHKRHADAVETAGILCLPGIGFSAVGDCLAAHLHIRMPEAQTLDLWFQAPRIPSPGTQRTAIRDLPRGAAALREGRLVSRPLAEDAEINLGAGTTPVRAIASAALVSAWHTTGIANVRAWVTAPFHTLQRLRRLNPVRWLLFPPPLRALAGWYLHREPPSGKRKPRPAKSIRMLGRATNRDGDQASSLLSVPEHYQTAATLSVEIARRCLDGAGKPGFRSPAKLFGPQLLEVLPGMRLEDKS